jgi:hypothetical protein
MKGDLIFADEEGVPRGHPQALTLVLLEYFLGVVWASPSFDACTSWIFLGVMHGRPQA